MTEEEQKTQGMVEIYEIERVDPESTPIGFVVKGNEVHFRSGRYVAFVVVHTEAPEGEPIAHIVVEAYRTTEDVCVASKNLKALREQYGTFQIERLFKPVSPDSSVALNAILHTVSTIIWANQRLERFQPELVAAGILEGQKNPADGSPTEQPSAAVSGQEGTDDGSGTNQADEARDR